MATANLRPDQRKSLQRTLDVLMESRRNRPRVANAEQQSLLEPIEPAPANFALPPQIADLVFQMPVRRRLVDLVLAPETTDEIQEFLYEFSQAGKLRNHSLDPRHTVLLVGPPGNGKTSLVEVIASELSLPLLAVRYDAIVDSYLGETSSRIRMLIDFASRTPCVLFFDEFDAIGKERSDRRDQAGGEFAADADGQASEPRYCRLRHQPSGDAGSGRLAALPGTPGGISSQQKGTEGLVRALRAGT